MNMFGRLFGMGLIWVLLAHGVLRAQNVSLQGTTPGSPQTGNFNVTGTGIAGIFSGQLRDKGGQVFSVKAYGAKGDNLTDDTSAIQSTITACQAGGGGIVFFPPGTYKTTGLSVTGQGVTLQGTPQSKIIGTSTTQWVILFDGSAIGLAYRNGIQALAVGHATQSQSSTVGAVRLLNQGQFLIGNLYTNPGGFGLTHLGVSFENAQIGTMVDSIIANTLGNRVVIQKSGNLSLSNILVSMAGGSGFTLDGVGGFWGYNLHAYHSGGFGFYISDSNTSDEYPSENMFFTACTGDTSGLPNWAVTAARRLSLDHCWGSTNISNTQNTWASGFYFAGALDANGYSSVSDVVVTGCWAVLNNKNGIEIADSQDVSVTSCEVLGNSMGQGNAEEGIVIRGKSSNIRLIGNRSRDDHLEFRYPFPKTQVAGIGIREQSDNIIAVGNDVQGNVATVGINDSAAASTKRLYRANLGYNPLVGVPQPAVSPSGVAVQNTTNVDCTVSLSGGTLTNVAIGGILTGIAASNTNYRVPVGSYITLYYSAAPTWRWIGE